MKYESLDSIAKTYNGSLFNPWIVNRISVLAIDSFVSTDCYYIGDVESRFSQDSVYISFLKQTDGLLGSFAASFMCCDEYAHDKALVVSCGASVINIGDWHDNRCVFTNIVKFVENFNEDLVVLKLTFKKIRCVYYHSVVILFIIHPDYDDYHFFNAECDRRNSNG